MSTAAAVAPPRQLEGLSRCALGPCLLGTAFLVTQQLPVSPMWNSVERVVPAGLLLLALRPALPRGSWWLRSLGLGALNFGAFFALQAFAVHRVPGAVVATVTATQAVLVPLLVALFGERIQPRQVAAAALGVVGVALLVLRAGHRLDAAGVAAALVLAGSAAAGMLLTRHWGTPPGTHHLSTTAWQMLAGGFALVPLAFMLEGGPPAMTHGQVLAAGWLAAAATAAAFALFFGGLHRGVPPATVARLALLSPVVAALLGWTFAGETLSPAQLVGIAMVLSAQLLGASRRG
ncbi:EamA family transporter [Pseudonocardia eucalypti]|uniref:EamA family transporter n=1 Tax=Pseudonocardia eucalypti TaxID=648755 RepID=A0ABP9REF9_9PSEU|nr:putative blue pigment (indigoidine) exporter [Pseudonocardia eucalypti]